MSRFVRAQPVARKHGPASKNGTRLLIVDDDEFQRETIRTLLQPEHYALTFAVNGMDALRQASVCTPDLILMDILMPGMDGMLTTQMLKHDTKLHRIPIIIITGQNQRNIVTQCIDLGASDYILKPFNQEILIRKIKKVLGT